MQYQRHAANPHASKRILAQLRRKLAVRPEEPSQPLEWDLREIENNTKYGVKVHLTETVYKMKIKIDIDPELIKDENGNKLEI